MEEEQQQAEEKILQIPGIEDNILVDEINQHVQTSSSEILRQAINSLLQKGKLEMSQGADKQVYCKLKDISYEGLDSDEVLVYECISKAGNKGIWTQDIKRKIGLVPNTTMNRVIKSLERKKKIKSVKSVLAGKKKVLMLYELEPDTSVTGDLFYSDQQEFDSEFTDVIFKKTLNELEAKAKEAAKNSKNPLQCKNNSFATIEEICEKINGSKVFKVQVKPVDMRKVLRSLSYSGRVECDSKTDSGVTVERYRVVTPLMKALSLVSMPCGACPVMQQCSDTGAVTPATCMYLTEWLNMDLPKNTSTQGTS